MNERKGWCLIKHKWGPWEYITDDECTQQRVCQRDQCHASEERLCHDWEPWIKTTPGSCVEERTCSRCGEREMRMGDHEWGEWEYINNRSCLRKRKCQRCGELDLSTSHLLGKQRHVWGTWQYENSRSCTKYRICVRCQKRDTSSPWVFDHQWGAWETERCSDNITRRIRYCSRCNTVDETATIDVKILAIPLDE